MPRSRHRAEQKKSGGQIREWLEQDRDLLKGRLER